MIDLFQNVLGGVTGGLLGERVKRHLDRLTNPVNGPAPTGSNEILEQIRDLLYAAAGSVHPPLHPLRQIITLQPSQTVDYRVTYEGRGHLNMLSPAAFNLFVESRIGTFTKAIPIGWSNLDLPDGTRLYTVVGDPNRTVQFEYAGYIHGVSI